VADQGHGRVLESYPDEGKCVDPIHLRFSHPGSSQLRSYIRDPVSSGYEVLGAGLGAGSIDNLGLGLGGAIFGSKFAGA
jgi:hypothetical protein